jgi:hypothetical protein
VSLPYPNPNEGFMTDQQLTAGTPRTSKYKMERTISSTIRYIPCDIVSVDIGSTTRDLATVTDANHYCYYRLLILILLNCHKQIYSKYIALSTSQATQHINKQRMWMGHVTSINTKSCACAEQRFVFSSIFSRSTR